VVGRCSGRQVWWQAGVVAVTEDLVQRGWLTKIKYIFGGYILHLKYKKMKYFFVVMYNASINKAIKYQTCIN
jgi:hypothetical protein